MSYPFFPYITLSSCTSPNRAMIATRLETALIFGNSMFCDPLCFQTEFDNEERAMLSELFPSGVLMQNTHRIRISKKQIMSPRKEDTIKKKTICTKKQIKAKRGRKKRSSVEGLPKQPLSGYNIFFKEERLQILKELTKRDKSNWSSTNDKKDEKKIQNSGLQLNSNANDKAKRKRGRPALPNSRRRNLAHGIIGFQDLAKLISLRWKKLSDEGVANYKKRAKVDQDRYNKEMEIFQKHREQIQIKQESVLSSR